MLIERLLSLFDPSGRSPAGYDYLFRAQKSMLARHSLSDVNLLGYGECIIDLDAEISNGALDFCVAGLVHPTALLGGLPVDLAQGLPEAQGPVAGGQLGADRQAAALEIEQHVAPGLGALPVAVGDCQQLFPAILIGAESSL